jgi:aldose 1-epimerase
MVEQIQNKHWQAGILPDAGGSLAFARMRYSGAWIDLIRPTPEGGSPGSFLMLPWANRIRDGLLRYAGEQWQLKTADDGTARHGDVRKRSWVVGHRAGDRLTLHFDTATHDDFNWPFALMADLIFRLEDADFVWQVSLTNTDQRSFPAGFGFHPYFVHPAENMPRVQIPCDKQFPLAGSMATGAAQPIEPLVDFREPRPITPDMTLDHLLTNRNASQPIRLIYEDWGVELQIIADELFQHVVVFTAPDGAIAVEPQTNANDGFNLMADGVPGHGVFEVAPGETVIGEVRLRLVTL